MHQIVQRCERSSVASGYYDVRVEVTVQLRVDTPVQYVSRTRGLRGDLEPMVGEQLRSHDVRHCPVRNMGHECEARAQK